MLFRSHRTCPVVFGERITLNINVRSSEHRYIDANDLTYLLADNHADTSWISEFIDDAIQCKLPDYQRQRAHIDA